MKRYILIALVFILSGCISMGNLPSVCDTATDSLLCDISVKNNVRLEDIGNVLIVTNAIAIGEGVYSQESALIAMKEIRGLLDGPVSYTAFRSGVFTIVDKYPGVLEVASIYFSQLTGNTQTMYPADREILISWLDSRIKTLER